MPLVLLILLIVFTNTTKGQHAASIYELHSVKTDTVKALFFSDYFKKHSKVPKRIITCKNLESISLSAPVRGIARMKGGYSRTIYLQSKLKTIPKWIAEFKNLKHLNLGGNYQLDYKKELVKLLPLDSLKTLQIDLRSCDSELIAILCRFKNMKLLTIDFTFESESDPLLLQLKECLPKCDFDYYYKK